MARIIRESLLKPGDPKMPRRPLIGTPLGSGQKTEPAKKQDNQERRNKS